MEQNILNNEEIEFVLHHNILGHLGCCVDNKVYVIPICYAYKEQKIYGRTYEGLKLQMIRKNPNVCFQVENIQNMARWQSVICWGEFVEIKEKGFRADAIDMLQQRISAVMESKAVRNSPFWPFSIEDPDNIPGILFCIHLTEITGRKPIYDEYLL